MKKLISLCTLCTILMIMIFSCSMSSDQLDQENGVNSSSVEKIDTTVKISYINVYEPDFGCFPLWDDLTVKWTYNTISQYTVVNVKLYSETGYVATVSPNMYIRNGQYTFNPENYVDNNDLDKKYRVLVDSNYGGSFSDWFYLEDY